MGIKTITYKRIKNLGNYESKTLEATCEVEQDPQRELEELIAFVENQLFPPKPVVESVADTKEEIEPPF